MMIWIKDVYPLGPYRLLLKLSTGEQYTLDCSELLQIPLFAKIRNPAFFSTVHTDETGLICWDNATDIEPGWLSAHLEPADTYPDIQAFRDLEKRLESELEGFHDDSALPELKQPLYGNTFRDIMKKYGMKPEDLDGWEDVEIE